MSWEIYNMYEIIKIKIEYYTNNSRGKIILTPYYLIDDCTILRLKNIIKKILKLDPIHYKGNLETLLYIIEGKINTMYYPDKRKLERLKKQYIIIKEEIAKL